MFTSVYTYIQIHVHIHVHMYYDIILVLAEERFACVWVFLRKHPDSCVWYGT